jgi:N-methylhydantoinase B
MRRVATPPAKPTRTVIPPPPPAPAPIRDPLAFELFKNALFAIADEMAVTICRTTYSGILRDNMDFSTSLADAEGRVVAQGLTVAMHLGSIRPALAAVLERFGDDLHPGDVVVLNDPFSGGMHLPDVFLFKPVFLDGERVAFAATTAHQADMGGRVPGSNASDSTEIYQEGLRLPPLKLFERGRPNETLWTVLRANVRLPVQVAGDLRAQLAACRIAERQLLELIERHGREDAVLYMGETTRYTERLVRAAVRELPDGEVDFEDWIDDDGVDLGQPIRIHVTVRKHDDRITFDWSGSAAQVRGAINSTLSVTAAASYTALRSILPHDIPSNDGIAAAVEVVAPPGSIANLVPPGACAARALTGFRMLDCAFGALAKLAPDRVFAASDGGNVGVSIGGYRADRTPFIYVDFTSGTWGGRPHADGLEGNSNLFVNMASQSVEVTEREQPLQILRYELAPDRCGAGRFRGGAPYYRDYRLTADEAVLQCRADRQAIRPYGLYGGKAGKPGSSHLDPYGENRRLGSKVTMSFRRGDVFRYLIAGGGGWGDPLERLPERVLRDVRNEIIGADTARREYGVVVEPGRWAVDAAQTEALRARMRREAGEGPAPFVIWDDGFAARPPLETCRRGSDWDGGGDGDGDGDGVGGGDGIEPEHRSGKP